MVDGEGTTLTLEMLEAAHRRLRQPPDPEVERRRVEMTLETERELGELRQRDPEAALRVWIEVNVLAQGGWPY